MRTTVHWGSHRASSVPRKLPIAGAASNASRELASLKVRGGGGPYAWWRHWGRPAAP